MWAELTWYNSCIVFLHLRFPTPSLQDLLRQWWELRFKTLLAKLSSNSESTVHCLVTSFMPSGLCKLRVTEQAGADSPRSWAGFSVHYFIPSPQAALRQETGTIREKEWERGAWLHNRDRAKTASQGMSSRQMNSGYMCNPTSGIL